MQTEPALPPGVKVLSVSDLTADLRRLLEDAFLCVWVGGEVSNFKKHASGHLYFTLKDAEAQIRAVVWRSSAWRVRFQVKDGLEVIARGRVSVFPPRGEYQLVIDELQPKGMGALELALRQLKEKLFQRGWFDPKRKKRLPAYPRRIALVTSPSGAALKDMLRIIPRRWPVADILLCPVAVQGAGAAAEIAQAIRRLNELRLAEVMIVGRGGGSLEDLWAFNEEIVAEAIFHSRIPVISAVGHQIDETIADLVADRRAATPSEAAELVVPDRVETSRCLADLRQRLTIGLRERLRAARKQVDALAQRRIFRQPYQWIRDNEQRLDEWSLRAGRAVRLLLLRCRERVQSHAAHLEGLSPLKVLGRGYSLTRREDGTTLIRSADDVRVGERIATRLARGELLSRVEQVRPERPDDA